MGFWVPSHMEYFSVHRCMHELIKDVRFGVPAITFFFLLQTGCEVMSNNTRSYSHLSQFIKNMFVICGPYRTELLLDYAMYLMQHNSDITEANELLTTKLSDKSLQSSVLLKAYAGLFAYLSWKKSKIQLDKKQLDNEEASVYGQDAQNSAASNLKRQMDFHAKQALAMFNNSVEHKGNWDIFVTKQVEILEYYNRSEEARIILEQYMEKNPENPNAYRYLYNFLGSVNNCIKLSGRWVPGCPRVSTVISQPIDSKMLPWLAFLQPNNEPPHGDSQAPVTL